MDELPDHHRLVFLRCGYSRCASAGHQQKRLGRHRGGALLFKALDAKVVVGIVGAFTLLFLAQRLLFPPRPDSAPPPRWLGGILAVTPGQAGDAPEARQLIEAMGPQEAGAVALLMDGAYQDNATRELVQAMGFVPVVPPSPTRRGTADAMRSSGCFASSRLGTGYVPAMTRLKSCSPPSSH